MSYVLGTQPRRRVMPRVLSTVAIIGWLLLIAGIIALQRYMHAQPPFEIKAKASAAVCEQKCQEDIPDPDRPYYDGLGNKYDAYGNLIEPADLPQPLEAVIVGK